MRARAPSRHSKPNALGFALSFAITASGLIMTIASRSRAAPAIASMTTMNARRLRGKDLLRRRTRGPSRNGTQNVKRWKLRLPNRRLRGRSCAINGAAAPFGQGADWLARLALPEPVMADIWEISMKFATDAESSATRGALDCFASLAMTNIKAASDIPAAPCDHRRSDPGCNHVRHCCCRARRPRRPRACRPCRATRS